MSDGCPEILIVDDEEANVMLLEKICKAEGYSTLTARDGQQGADVAREELPDLILLDIMMPGMGGFQACKMLKEDAETTDIPVIFVSATSEVSSKVEGLELGAVDYITKPFNREEILARVRMHLKLNNSYKEVICEQAEKLKQVHDAQQSILKKPDDLPAAKFGVYYKAVNEAGGDFYDVVAIGEGIFGYFVADISGHNLGTSFTTPAVKVLLNQFSSPMYTPTETMKQMNSVLCTMMDDGGYLTASYVRLNRMRSQLEVVSAGHPPVIYLASNEKPEHLELTGDVLGAFEKVCFEPLKKKTSLGDRFFIYSDGLIELKGKSTKARNGGVKKLTKACMKHCKLPIDEAVEAICKDVLGRHLSCDDDVVLLGVEV